MQQSVQCVFVGMDSHWPYLDQVRKSRSTQIFKVARCKCIFFGYGCTLYEAKYTCAYILRPNRLGLFGLMAWRCALKRVGPLVVRQTARRRRRRRRRGATNCWPTRDMYHTAGVQRVRSVIFRSAMFFVSDFFGDDLASYRNSLISCKSPKCNNNHAHSIFTICCLLLSIEFIGLKWLVQPSV